MCGLFFYQQFPRFPFHRPRSSPLEIKKWVNTWIIQLSCTGICLCSWGEGAAAETYKSRRVGGPERRVYIGGKSDYVVNVQFCKLQIVSKNDIFTTGDGGYFVHCTRLLPMSRRPIWYLIYQLKDNLQITVCLLPLIGGIQRIKCSVKLLWLLASQ